MTGEAGSALIQTVVVEFTRGDRPGEQVAIRYGEAKAITAENRVRVGDRVLVEVSAGPEGELTYISDFVRWPSLIAAWPAGWPQKQAATSPVRRAQHLFSNLQGGRSQAACKLVFEEDS